MIGWFLLRDRRSSLQLYSSLILVSIGTSGTGIPSSEGAESVIQIYRETLGTRMNLVSEIQRRREPIFPSLRTLSLHRVALKDSTQESQLPREIQEEITILRSASEENRIRIAYERGDIWIPVSQELRGTYFFTTSELRWVVVSGHVWAVEAIRRVIREFPTRWDFVPSEFDRVIAEYGSLCRHRHLIERYLVPRGRDDVIRWYTIFDGGHVFHEADQTLGYTLIAILEDDVEFLETVPWDRANRETIESLISISSRCGSMESLRYLLQFLPHPTSLMIHIAEEALVRDDLELFSTLYDFYSKVPQRAPMFLNGPPLMAAKHGVEKIFFRYCRRDHPDEYIEQIFKHTRSSRISQWVSETYPQVLDWSVGLMSPSHTGIRTSHSLLFQTLKEKHRVSP